jgi:YidC/Oxa1 family membrane protein insertase
VFLSASLLSPLEHLIRELLIWLHGSAGLTWAWSIIALTAIVRLAIFPITSKQTRSSLAMQRLQPHIKTLQARYKDDRQALNQAMMEFYRDNKVNPLASCFPLLIQIPIFLSLFFVIRNFAQHPPAGSNDFSFLFGFVSDITTNINDSWQGYVLLVIYVLSQMLSTITMMNSPNPQQKYIFLAMPLLFVPVVMHFPIGVMLYWITTNLWSLGQYLVVVALTDKDKEIVLPADTKGRKKVITPKGANKGQKAGAGGGGAAKAPNAPVRRNKRRK